MPKVALSHDLDLIYPSDNGEPMSENTEQYEWIVLIKENLQIIFKAVLEVFVAADLLWYPVEVENPPAPSQAPDVMVVFGRPKGLRMSYKQWQEGGIAPQVVFEILSPSNKVGKGKQKMAEKFEFYDRHGVEEYYIYDPLDFSLQGWIRQGENLQPIAAIGHWISPRLQVRFEWEPGQKWILYRPDGIPFRTTEELDTEIQQQQFRAEQAYLRAEQERQEKERLAAYLRSLGFDPDQLPNV